MSISISLKAREVGIHVGHQISRLIVLWNRWLSTKSFSYLLANTFTIVAHLGCGAWFVSACADGSTNLFQIIFASD
ncbi:MAG: hypothetical protein ACLP5V_06630 [Candidatus Bathyarchaeia archaeon]